MISAKELRLCNAVRDGIFITPSSIWLKLKAKIDFEYERAKSLGYLEFYVIFKRDDDVKFIKSINDVWLMHMGDDCVNMRLVKRDIGIYAAVGGFVLRIRESMNVESGMLLEIEFQFNQPVIYHND